MKADYDKVSVGSGKCFRAVSQWIAGKQTARAGPRLLRIPLLCVSHCLQNRWQLVTEGLELELRGYLSIQTEIWIWMQLIIFFFFFFSFCAILLTTNKPTHPGENITSWRDKNIWNAEVRNNHENKTWYNTITVLRISCFPSFPDRWRKQLGWQHLVHIWLLNIWLVLTVMKHGGTEAIPAANNKQIWAHYHPLNHWGPGERIQVRALFEIKNELSHLSNMYWPVPKSLKNDHQEVIDQSAV